MSFAPLPVTAAWQHRGLRSGFEVVYFSAAGDRCRMEGWTTAVEDGATWVVEYAIEVDAAGATRSAVIRGRSAAGSCTARLEADGNGRWLVDGQPAPGLDGCLDVDLESSALTNALPVRRMGLPVAARPPPPPPTSAPSAWRWSGWSRPTRGPPTRPAASVTTTPPPPSTSPPAWSTTNPAWYSTTPGSPPGPSDRPRQTSLPELTRPPGLPNSPGSEAVKTYNELAESVPVDGLFHSTC